MLARPLRELRERSPAAAVPPIVSERVPCRIAGVEASCERIVVAGVLDDAAKLSAGKSRYVAMWGSVTLDGKPTIAVCHARGDAPVPQPCAAVFALR